MYACRSWFDMEGRFYETKQCLRNQLEQMQKAAKGPNCDGEISMGMGVVMQCDISRKLVQLQAVVDKLPKTADGVLIEPSMKVYAFDPIGYLQGYDVQGMGMCDDSSSPSVAYIPWLRCYSTHEAAREAAKEDG